MSHSQAKSHIVTEQLVAHFGGYTALAVELTRVSGRYISGKALWNWTHVPGRRVPAAWLYWVGKLAEQHLPGFGPVSREKLMEQAA